MDETKSKLIKRGKNTLAFVGLLFLTQVMVELVFNPLISSGRDLILDISSFGLEKFKNDTYRQIAKGFHESFSLQTHLIINFILVSGVALLFIEVFRLFFKLQKLTQDKKSGIAPPQLSIDELNKKNERRAKKVYLGAAMLAITVILFFIKYGEDSYINKAVTYYNQVLNIALPHLDSKKEKEIRAAFSSISNRDDYAKIIEELRDIATKNGRKLPDFDIW